MTPISFLQQLYSLDTLDTRFTIPARTPLKAANAGPAQDIKLQDEKSPATLPPGASPSRWRTPEFYFYALIHLIVVPQMFKAVVDVSQCTYRLMPALPLRPVAEKPSDNDAATHSNYPKFVDLLSPGWIPGRKVVRRSSRRRDDKG
jgi:protein-cysteine N-palmitoyltransferase HHAT